jgi:translation initiation factor 2B subunit (eIF-2B alpha/beta/delta family)
MGSRQLEPDPTELRRALSETDVPRQLSALAQMGLRSSDLAAALRVSTESIRVWKRGGHVRPQNREALDHLRSAVLTLLQADDVAAAARWLTATSEGSRSRALDRVRDHPAEVQAAAAAFASDLRRDGPGEPTATITPVASVASAESTERSSTEVKTEISGKLRAIASKPASQQEMLAKIDALESDSALLPNPNYVAPMQLIARIRREVEQASTQPPDEVILRELTVEDSTELKIGASFAAWGKAHLVAGVDEPILVYALSMRVVQALRGADSDVQAATRLFIAECRVKSAPPSGNLASFGDGAETWRYLRKTGYHTSLVFDIDAADYVRRKKVKRLLVGAQQLRERPDGSYEIVATAGTDLLLTLAREHGLEVNILAETRKGEEFDPKRIRTDDRILTIALPSGEIAPLQTSKEELCVIRGAELVTENWDVSETAGARDTLPE